MTKRLIDIDDDLLAAAKQELSTTGIADTVRSALRFAAARSARVRQVEWLTAGGMSELVEQSARDEVWR
jgi:Arc/MetJ family transcription regulator